MNHIPRFPDPDIIRDQTDTLSLEEPSTEEQETNMKAKNKKVQKTLSPHRLTKPFRPIILCIGIAMLWSVNAFAMGGGSISLGTTYSDNVFALSDYDFERWDHEHPNLDFVKSTDDLSIVSKINLNYPMRYRWWKIIPSINANISNNVSNTEKYRRDMGASLRLERYYFNTTLSYTHNPHIYVRHYVDSDGTGAPEAYSYQRDTYQASGSIRIAAGSNLNLQARLEDFYYNRYWTEFDGRAITMGLGYRHNFDAFVLSGMYYYRIFDNDFDPESGHRDSSYESDRYTARIILPKMPLADSKPKGAAWQPALSLSYEERYYQGQDSWYGGRVDKMYNTGAGLTLFFNPDWNLSLDYSHIFRNVDSSNASVLSLKEYSENRLSAELKYSF